MLINGFIETAPGAIVIKLASHFASVYSSEYYSPAFRITKMKGETKIILFGTVCSDDYNFTFTLSELLSPLSCAQNTARGPDQIHNSMLKNSPDTALHFVLSPSLYNLIWLKHTLPDC